MQDVEIAKVVLIDRVNAQYNAVDDQRIDTEGSFPLCESGCNEEEEERAYIFVEFRDTVLPLK